jgi:hypothetical protein
LSPPDIEAEPRSDEQEKWNTKHKENGILVNEIKKGLNCKRESIKAL